MALDKVKTEMRGTGGGRWCPRADAKLAANHARRRNDEDEIKMAINVNDKPTLEPIQAPASQPKSPAVKAPPAPKDEEKTK